jgi:hypothetical protein
MEDEVKHVAAFEKAAAESTAADSGQAADIAKWTVKELKAYCKAHQLSMTGRKGELAVQVTEHMHPARGDPGAAVHGGGLRLSALDLEADFFTVVNTSSVQTEPLSLAGWSVQSGAGGQNYSFPQNAPLLRGGENVSVWSGGKHKRLMKAQARREVVQREERREAQKRGQQTKRRRSSRGGRSSAAAAAAATAAATAAVAVDDDEPYTECHHLSWTARYIWNNDGDSAILRNPAGDVIDLISVHVSVLEEDYESSHDALRIVGLNLGDDNCTVRNDDAARAVCLDGWLLRSAAGKQEFSVRARPGWLSALSVFHSRSVLYGAFVWAPRALNIQTRWFPARVVPRRLRTRRGGDRDHLVRRAARAPGKRPREPRVDAAERLEQRRRQRSSA